MIIITRCDLSIGYQAQQSTHSIAQYGIEHPIKFKEWDKELGYIILLEVRDEKELLKFHSKLESKGIENALFSEPDLNNEYTSLCFYANSQERKIISSLRLLGSSQNMQIKNQNKK